MQVAFDLALIAILAATLVQAVRLERALGVLKRDRAALEQLVNGFNASTRQAEQSIERLRATADGAGRQLARQIDAAAALKDDLQFLAERGDKVADRLDGAVRNARDMAPDSPRDAFPPGFAETLAEPEPEPPPRLRSQAERDLFNALRLAR